MCFQKTPAFFVCIILLWLMLLSGCSGDKPSAAGQAPLITVSILPQSYFVERISAGRVRALTLVGPGQNPHSYEPSPQQMADLAAAGAWVLSGTEFEVSLRPKIEALFPLLPVIDGTAGVHFRMMDDHDDDGDGHDSSGGGRDPHTWLGREPAKIMAAHIRDALSTLDPVHAALYEENCAALFQDIDREFQTLALGLAPLRGRSVFVYHPSFGYFLDEFGLVQEAVETGGKEPSPKALSALLEKARKEGAAAIFVQAQFPANAARTAAEALGVELVALDPLSPDWLANIRLMGGALKKALTGPVSLGAPLGASL